jgi:hypothetical protein
MRRRRGKAGRLRGSRFLLPCLLAAGALVLPAAASGQILNTAGVNNGGVTQTTWLESFATVGEDTGGVADRLRVSMIVQHPVGREVTGLRIDDDWDNTNEATSAAIKNVTAQQPNVTGGYGYSRITFSYDIPTSGTDFSCGTFDGTRRTDGNSVHVRARMDDGSETGTSSSRVKFIAAGNCQGIGGQQDYGSIRSWGANNFNQSIEPGDAVNFSYTCDDPDTDVLSSDDECGGVRWRRRNLMTGVTSATGTDCVDGGDNSTKNTSVTFPNRGRWVVEVETLEEDCDTSSGSYWFPIGAVDVNSTAAPSIALSPNTTRPNTNANVTVTADLPGDVAGDGKADGNDPDEADGGHAEYVEWDLDNDGSFDDEVDRAGPTTSFASDPTAVINTTGMTPGTKTVRARVTDNGAMGGADNIRRTSSAVSTTFTVNSPPTANAQTVSAESNLAKAITLTGSDPNSDPLTFDVVDPPDRGDICTTASGGCTEGTGANRFYRPDGNFAGTDTFTIRAFDNHNGQSASTATVTVNVTPHTQITSAPDATSGSSTANFQFSTPVTIPPTVTFECRIDSTLESDFTACSSPKQYLGLSDGSHTVEVRARTGSFVDPTPASHTWSIDATSPETFIDTGPDDPTASDSASFTFHSDDPAATFECRLDSDQEADFTACASGQTYNLLDEGEHTFEVRAVDSFNRRDPIPATYTWDVDLTAPEVTIDSAPEDPTNDTTPEFEFSSTDLTATFECELDGGGFSPCTSPRSYGPLGEGPHTFTVKPSDPAGNDGAPVSHTWTIDTTVPDTTIDDGPTAQTTSSVANFLFSSDDPSAAFECRLDSTDPGDWEECSSPQLYADVADGFHTFEVRAVDAAGNADASPATQSWEVDGSAPQTTIEVSPDAATSSTTADFEFSSDDPAATFECKLDGGAWGPCTDPQQYTGLAEGTHVFRVKATDAFGNADQTPASRTWTIDTTGPTVSIGSGPQDPSPSPTGIFHFDADEPASFECRFDSTVEADFEDCNSPSESDLLSDGPHTFDVRATDGVGNVGATVSRSWTSDTTAPDVQIDTGMPATTSSSSSSFAFSSTDGTATFQCRLDDGAWQGCTSPRNYGGLDDGAHSFDVRSRDSVGNTSDPVASDDWTVVDSGPPNTQIDGAPGSPTLATDASFSFTSSEPATFECSLDGGAFAPCGPGAAGTSGTKDYTGLATGQHTFAVRATDDDDDGPKTDGTPAEYDWLIDVPPATGGGGGGGSGGVAGAAAQSPKITPGKGPLKRGRGVAATVECGTDPCSLSGKAKVKIGGRSFRARIKAATSLGAGQAATVSVLLSKAARAALAAAGKGRLKLSLTATGGGAPVTQQIKLKVTK